MPYRYLLPSLFLIYASAAVAQQPQSDLQEIEKALVEKAAEESRLKNEAANRSKELKALQQQMIDTADALQSAEAEIKQLAGEIDTLQTQESGLSQQLSAEQERLGDVLAALQSLERHKPPALLVSPQDANQAARAAMLLAQAAPALEAEAAKIRITLTELAAIRSDLDQKRRDQIKANTEIAARRDVLSELLAQKRKERDVATRMAAAAQRETAALAARASSLRDVLQRLKRFARSISPRLKPPPPQRRRPGATPSTIPPPPSRKALPPRFAPQKSFASALGSLKSPVTGDLVGRFGQRRPEGGKFDGLRFVTADQAIVTAPFEADVLFARFWDPYGNLVVLDVGAGYHILFMGIGSFLVEEGQEVSAGEPLGLMVGNEARLDMEVRKGGDPINPAAWLREKQ